MSLFSKRDTDLDIACGCVACGVCRGVGYDIEDSSQHPCDACNGLTKAKLCRTHAIEAGWIEKMKTK